MPQGRKRIALQKQIVRVEGRYQYYPSPKQRIFHTATQRFKLYGGAVGGGKTRGLCQECFYLCEDFPGNKIYACRKDGTDFNRNVLPVLLEEAIPPQVIAGHNKNDQLINLVNGSSIRYGGCDDIEKIKNYTLGAVAVDQAEEISYEAFQMLDSRLRLKIPDIRYYMLLSANPAPGWLKDMFIPAGGTTEVYINGDKIYIPARPSENPGNPADYEDRLRMAHDADWVRRYVDGDWTALAGQVYSVPAESIQPFSKLYKPADRVFLSVDFGFRRPSVLWFQRRGEFIYVIYELDVQNITTGDLAMMVKEINKKQKFNVIGGYCDPAGAARNPQTGIPDVREFERVSGIRMIHTVPQRYRDIVAGVNLVKTKLKDGTGKSWLFIARECKWLLTCFENYIYPPHRSDHELKEEPVKDGIHDHAMDALRYFIITNSPEITSTIRTN